MSQAAIGSISSDFINVIDKVSTIVHKISGNRYCLNNHYSVAVIDFFTLYDNYKAAERWYKIYIRRVNRNLISVMSPVEYYQRLLKFVSNIFIDEEYASKVTSELTHSTLLYLVFLVILQIKSSIE